ncbi:hypothetical protein [Deefgea salmonis]|uniref:DUF5610 domain-containing protein n=1 Tax=Deefgea salmonis TaxID=2875502 RepID=A0ABS8BKM5_9NEIS|nr:hypothetical protein [Deefgea salmonis]MCB5196275.1 hypothetical protein [Deefgea salmonis]
MSISVSNQSSIPPLTGRLQPQPNKSTRDESNLENSQETVSLNTSGNASLTYSKPRALPENLAAMLDESNRKVDELMSLIRPLIEGQGLNLAKVARGEQTLTVDQATIDKAKADLGEDGEFGVKKVAERILSFAKFAMGDDPAKLQKIRDAVELGFTQAKAILGGSLPDISQQTHDTIMAEFDRWQQEGIPSGATVGLGAKPAQT